MSTWRQYAERVQRGNDGRDNRGKRDNSPEIEPNGPIVPNVPPHPSLLLREWHTHLSRLDPDRPPDGCKAWWRQAVEDCWWFYENYSSRAVRDGWSALDQFGVLPHKPTTGGVAVMLQGARNLKMEGRKAVWSRWGVPDTTCAGMDAHLLSSGLVLLWEVGR